MTGHVTVNRADDAALHRQVQLAVPVPLLTGSFTLVILTAMKTAVSLPEDLFRKADEVASIARDWWNRPEH